MKNTNPKIIRLFLIILLLLSVMIIVRKCIKSNSNNKTLTICVSSKTSIHIPLLKDIISKFEKENHCKIELKIFSEKEFNYLIKNKKFHDSVCFPDLIEGNYESIKSYHTQFSLFSQIPDSLKNNDNVGNTYNSYKYLAIPWLMETKVLFVNNSLIKKVTKSQPAFKSFKEVLDISGKINSLDSCYGFGIVGPDEENLLNNLLIFFWSNGGDLLDEKGKLTIYKNANLEAFKFYLQLAENGLIETQMKIESEFVKGKLGFCISDYSLIGKINNENKNLNYSVIEIPKLNDKQGISLMNRRYFGINSKSKNIETAMKFLKYINSEQVSEFIISYQNIGYFPVKKDVIIKHKYNDEVKSVFAKQIINSKVFQPDNNQNELNKIIETRFIDAIYSVKPADEVFIEAQEDSRKLILK